MLYGPTYPNLIKEFWENARIQELNPEYAIISIVYDVPIIITPTSITNAILCEDEGVVLDMMFLESSLFSHLIFDNLSNLSKVSNLNSRHQSDIQPYAKEKDLDYLGID